MLFGAPGERGEHEDSDGVWVSEDEGSQSVFTLSLIIQPRSELVCTQEQLHPHLLSGNETEHILFKGESLQSALMA